MISDGSKVTLATESKKNRGSLAKEAARESNQTRVADVTLIDAKHWCKTAKNWQKRWRKHKGAAKNFIHEKEDQEKLGHHLSSHDWSWSIKKWKKTLVKHVKAVWKKTWRRAGTYVVNVLH